MPGQFQPTSLYAGTTMLVLSLTAHYSNAQSISLATVPVAGEDGYCIQQDANADIFAYLDGRLVNPCKNFLADAWRDAESDSGLSMCEMIGPSHIQADNPAEQAYYLQSLLNCPEIAVTEWEQAAWQKVINTHRIPKNLLLSMVSEQHNRLALNVEQVMPLIVGEEQPLDVQLLALMAMHEIDMQEFWHFVEQGVSRLPPDSFFLREDNEELQLDVHEPVDDILTFGVISVAAGLAVDHEWTTEQLRAIFAYQSRAEEMVDLLIQKLDVLKRVTCG